MSVRDDRLPPFAWLDLKALDRIREQCPSAQVASVRNIYAALTESASRALDPQQANFKTTRSALAHLAGVSTKTVDRACAILTELGILAIEPRVDDDGRTLPSVYRLVRGGDTESPRGDGRKDTESPPITRARDEKKKNEERPSAGSRAKDASQTLPDGFPEDLKPHARDVFRVLRSVAEQYNAKEVTPRAVGHAIMSAPGRRYVEEAHKMAAWCQGTSRPVRDVVSRYQRWLGNADTYSGVEPLGVPIAASAGGLNGGSHLKLVNGRERVDWGAIGRELEAKGL
jgi:hypothetical protein